MSTPTSSPPSRPRRLGMRRLAIVAVVASAVLLLAIVVVREEGRSLRIVLGLDGYGVSGGAGGGGSLEGVVALTSHRSMGGGTNAILVFPEKEEKAEKDLRHEESGGNKDDDGNDGHGHGEDWFDADIWDAAGSPCFYVENVCHGAFRFFYDVNDSHSGGVGGSSSGRWRRQRPHQPPWTLYLNRSSPHAGLRVGFPSSIVVAPATRGDGGGSRRHRSLAGTTTTPRRQLRIMQPSRASNSTNSCPYAPVANHIVLFSIFNDMLGEFYARTLPGLMAARDVALSSSYSYSSLPGVNGGAAAASSSSWERQTQLYLHHYPQKPVMESHKLFLEPFSSNTLLPFEALLERTSCRCLRRLFFCGFDATVTYEDRANGGDGGGGNGDGQVTIDEAERKGEVEKDDKKSRRITSATLVPGGVVWKGVDSGKNGRAYSALRDLLLEKVVRDNTELDRVMEEFRQTNLANLGLPPYPPSPSPSSSAVAAAGRDGDIDGDEGGAGGGATGKRRRWKFVGLSQRKVRRRWLNFDRSLARCNAALNSLGAACVELNIEQDIRSNPVSHVAIHRAVDMVIGVHGAQLTDAIWLRDGSVVLELLPYVPDGLVMGPWTRSVRGPTPLGVIYTESGLYHLGYRLGLDSVPPCFSKSSPMLPSLYAKVDDEQGVGSANQTEQEREKERKKEEEKKKVVECLKENRWDVRDFEVDDDVVIEAARRFLLSDEAVRTDCSELRRMAEASDLAVAGGVGKEEKKKRIGTFVLYNVPCAEAKGGSINEEEGEGEGKEVGDGVRVRHFYQNDEYGGEPF